MDLGRRAWGRGPRDVTFAMKFPSRNYPTKHLRSGLIVRSVRQGVGAALILRSVIQIANTECASQRALCASTGSGLARDTRPSVIPSVRSGLVIVRTK